LDFAKFRIAKDKASDKRFSNKYASLPLRQPLGINISKDIAKIRINPETPRDLKEKSKVLLLPRFVYVIYLITQSQPIGIIVLFWFYTIVFLVYIS